MAVKKNTQKNNKQRSKVKSRKPKNNKNEESLTVNIEIQKQLSVIQNEIANMQMLVPPDGFVSTKEIASKHIEYFNDLLERTGQFLRSTGMNVDKTVKIDGEKVPHFDFSWQSYKEFEGEYRNLVAVHRRKGIFVNSTVPVSYAMSRPGWDFVVPWWLEKLLKLFGVDLDDIDDVGKAFRETVGEDLFQKVWESANLRKWNDLADLLYELLAKLLDNIDVFFEKIKDKLARRYGRSRAAKKAGKIIAKIASKFIPFAGWGVFILELLWYITENLMDAMV